MKKIFSMVVVSVAISLLLFQIAMPIVATAQQSTPCPTGKICNPLNANSIQDLISEALKFVVNLLAIAGVLYIIWSGLMFVKAQGNPEELKKAKKSFINAIIGMAIILGAWAIATVIANTINQVTGNNDVTLKP